MLHKAICDAACNAISDIEPYYLKRIAVIWQRNCEHGPQLTLPSEHFLYPASFILRPLRQSMICK